jgi:hypothetical protein
VCSAFLRFKNKTAACGEFLPRLHGTPKALLWPENPWRKNTSTEHPAVHTSTHTHLSRALFKVKCRPVFISGKKKLFLILHYKGGSEKVKPLAIHFFKPVLHVRRPCQHIRLATLSLHTKIKTVLSVGTDISVDFISFPTLARTSQIFAE